MEIVTHTVDAALMIVQEYVVGFAFEDKPLGGMIYTTPRVLLIRKNRPEWQKGKFNGPGGKIKPQEGPDAAMVREMMEETGLLVLNWKHFVTLQDEDSTWRVYFFHGTATGYPERRTDEEPFWSDWTRWNHTTPVVPNLRALVPLAYYRDVALPYTIIQQTQPELSELAYQDANIPQCVKQDTEPPEMDQATMDALRELGPKVRRRGE